MNISGKFLDPQNHQPQPPENNSEGWASILLGLVVLAACYYLIVFIFSLGYAAYMHLSFLILSSEAKNMKCALHKANTLLYNSLRCPDISDRYLFNKLGSSACIKFFSSFGPYPARLTNTYIDSGDPVYQILFNKSKDPKALSLAECRRDQSINNGITQWREIPISKKGEPLTRWSSKDNRFYFSHPNNRCLGLTLLDCNPLLIDKNRDQVIAPDRSTQGSRSQILEQEARDEIEKFKEWSGDGPAPQPIPAMEKLWRCNKYGDCNE